LTNEVILTGGGAYPAPLLPPFWRAIGNSIPNGAGGRIVYFSSHSVGGNLLVMAIYTVAGVAITITGASV
jgi:hypothetical protein